MRVWADRIKTQRPETRLWHYVNIPLGAEGYDFERDCPKANCMVAKLEQFVALLRSDAPEDQTGEALRFVIHLVTDMHQPLHGADNDHRGGNDVLLRSGNRRTTLHEIWDHYVLIKVLNQVMDATAGGTVVDWCNESHAIAQQVVYDGLPAAGQDISEEYMRKARNSATDQLALAATRLAALLNAALRR